MSQTTTTTQIRQCTCDEPKEFMGVYPNEPITIFCKTCSKDSTITNGGRIIEINTGKEVKIAKL